MAHTYGHDRKAQNGHAKALSRRHHLSKQPFIANRWTKVWATHAERRNARAFIQQELGWHRIDSLLDQLGTYIEDEGQDHEVYLFGEDSDGDWLMRELFGMTLEEEEEDTYGSAHEGADNDYDSYYGPRYEFSDLHAHGAERWLSRSESELIHHEEDDE
jgi:hypothetical protein